MEKIKSLSQHPCPHCGNSILVEFETTPPTVINTFTEDQIIKAKEDVLTAIKNMDAISEEEKKNAEAWVKKEDVIFGPDDVERIIKDVAGEAEEE